MNELTNGTQEIKSSDIHKNQPENRSALREARDYLRDAASSEHQDISLKEPDKWNVENSFDRTSENWGGKYVEEKIRMDKTPVNDGGWEAERGTSKFIPDGNTEAGLVAKEKLAEFRLDGIEYKNLEPDFSKCSEATVQIDNMTDKCPDNFRQADEKLAEQWNKEKKDGRQDYSASDVRKYRDNNKLTWHERCDTKTVDLVPREIHEFFLHSGGRAECRARDGKETKLDE